MEKNTQSRLRKIIRNLLLILLSASSVRIHPAGHSEGRGYVQAEAAG